MIMSLTTYSQDCDADWAEFKQAETEQERLDFDIATLMELVDRNGVEAVRDWLNSIDMRKAYESSQRNANFLFWSEGNCCFDEF